MVCGVDEKKILIFYDPGAKKIIHIPSICIRFFRVLPFLSTTKTIWPTPCVSLVTQVDNTYILILFWNHRKTMIKYEITKQNSALKQNKNLLSLFKMKSTVFKNLSKFSNTVKEEIFASLSNPD